MFDTRQYRQSLPEGTELYWSLPNPFKGNKVLLKLNILSMDSHGPIHHFYFIQISFIDNSFNRFTRMEEI